MNALRARQFHDVVAFRDCVLPLLLEHEAHNCVILGFISRFSDPALHRPNEPLPYMAAVEDNAGRPVLAATISGPYPILVTPSPVEALDALREHLKEIRLSPCGVTSALATAQAFASRWSQQVGCACRHDTRLGVYQCERILPPRPAAGALRPASAGDLPVVVPFARAFYHDINEPLDDSPERVESAIREKRLFLWCDGDRVVSMAAWAGPTPNGVRVNFVYTPPELRGRGYASNCVAALTQRLLDSGRKFVFLFTDMANPTSNAVYKAIGYRHLGDQQKIFFDPPTQGE